MKRIRYLLKEAGAPYYRARPWEILRLIYAKLKLSSHHVSTPQELLTLQHIDVARALDGLDKWEVPLAQACRAVRAAPGHQGGVSMGDGIVLYGCTRFLRPDLVVETGVGPGLSTSFILAALIDNGKGRLYSIELPPSTRSATRHDEDGASFAWQERGVGWAIPEAIRSSGDAHHRLVLEDVRDALPRLMGEIGTVDMFVHDDLHTPNHMRWEYELVWPHLKDGGLLISDDVNWGWLAFARGKSSERELYLANLDRLALIRKAPENLT